MAKPVTIRRHAILKRHYRRAVAAAPDFHTMTHSEQWALLRNEVVANFTPGPKNLLEIMDSRESRRDVVLAALEEARQMYPR